MTRSAAFSDLDRTVIATSSTPASGRPLSQAGLINRRAVPEGADEHLMHLMRAQITAMCTGWDVQVGHDIVRETLHTIVDPLVHAEAADLVEEHRAAGREVVIVSGSGAETVGPIGEMLGVDRVAATRTVVQDGRCTGEIACHAYGENEAAAMREVATEMGCDLAGCRACSDSVSDLSMRSAVGHPTAVDPDRALRRAAAERGWAVLAFTRPVASGARPYSTRTPIVTGAAVGIGAAVAWHARRRALRPVVPTCRPAPPALRRRRRGA